MADRDRQLSRRDALKVLGVAGAVVVCGRINEAIYESNLSRYNVPFYDDDFVTQDVRGHLKVETSLNDFGAVKAASMEYHQILPRYVRICADANAIQTAYAELAVNPNALNLDYGFPASLTHEFCGTFAEISTRVINGKVNTKKLHDALYPLPSSISAVRFERVKDVVFSGNAGSVVDSLNDVVSAQSSFKYADRVFKAGVGWQSRDLQPQLDALIVRNSRCLTQGVGLVGQSLVTSSQGKGPYTMREMDDIVCAIDIISTDFRRGLLEYTDKFLERGVSG